MSSTHRSTVLSLASDVKSGSVKDRLKAVEDLTHLLNPRNRNTNLSDLGDKGYHEIFEAVFNLVLREKPSLYDKRKSQATANAAADRLSKCAAAVRVAVARGASRLGRKTILAVIDHITQVLPGQGDDFVFPLLQDYVKALVELLSHEAHVELLSRKDGASWEICVDFLLDIIEHVSPEEVATFNALLSPSARASPAPGSSSIRSTGRSTASAQNRKKSNQSEASLKDALQGLVCLAKASNAPMLRRYKEMSAAALKVLRLQQLSLGSVQSLCFSIVNAAFSATQIDDFNHANALVRQVLPLMSFWWRAEKVSQDELIRGLRNEILQSLFLMQSNILHLTLRLRDKSVLGDLEDLAETLWLEYSKRSDSHRLQTSDLTFAVSDLPQNSLRVDLFALRPCHVEGESSWALVQNLAAIETTLVEVGRQKREHGDGDPGQPRKKRRIDGESNRFRQKLKLQGAATSRTALQLVPFMLASNSLRFYEVSELLENLIAFAGDRDANVSSWALIACASCSAHREACDGSKDIWRQLWHLGAKLASLPATSRAACLLLRAILEADMLPYHEVSAEVNSFVTTADVNGPGLLFDTSISLMLQLFHVRNVRLPGASQATSNHIIRWSFLRWRPHDANYAAFQSPLNQPLELVNLLRVCCGLSLLSFSKTQATFGGPLSAAWKSQSELSSFQNYLLLLDHTNVAWKPSSHNSASAIRSSASAIHDPDSFYTSRKLVLELLHPKLEELAKLSSSWNTKVSEGGLQISLTRFDSLFSACIVGALLTPELSNLNTTQSSAIQSLLMEVAETGVAASLSSVEPISFIERILRLMRPYIPDLTTSSLERLQSDSPDLLLLHRSTHSWLDVKYAQWNDDNAGDGMDIDDEFESQSSRGALNVRTSELSRHMLQLTIDPRAFRAEARIRLSLLSTIGNDSSQVGLVPDAFVDELLSMADDEILCCSRFLVEVVGSDLTLSPGSLLSIIERLGAIISQSGFQCCEVALMTCIEILDASCDVWLQDDQQLSENAGDLYNHFVKTCLPSNFFSGPTQNSMARFLLSLLKANEGYASGMGLDSCRTSLLYILQTGTMAVKCHVAEFLPDIFDLFILMLHDEVFVDVLDSLPTDAENIAGIAFRLYALSKMACKWPTLLRRCTYHIFETPGKVDCATEHATWCLAHIADNLGLESPRNLFSLFSRQILYTWLEVDTLEDIPFAIFGFASLADLLRAAQAEATGLLIMRGQEKQSHQLARLLGQQEHQLIRGNFAMAVALSMMFGDQHGDPYGGKGERYIVKKLGEKAFVEAVYVNFADIIALFFELVDQESSIEKTWGKLPNFKYASDIMIAIKKMSHSPANLPPNQQPSFRARLLMHEIHSLCSKTEFQLESLWTPALVCSITRKLFDAVHPALGSLHACSVLRKVRIIICVAGDVALESYCLEMLLNSIRNFVVDSECADDALGISQYLLSKGSNYLSQAPSFLAGYGLSILASLRVFLESSQSSTTQESQFKATMDKAQRFHGWLTAYLANYQSPVFKDERQKQAFKSIMHSAARIKSSGNAEKNTFESSLLLDILKDEAAESQLLNESSRRLALGLLCGTFQIPMTTRDDVIACDSDASRHAAAIWRSCQAQNLSKEYLSWAGRAIGRSFSARGSLPEGILHESDISQYRRLGSARGGSEAAILRLLQKLTSEPDSEKAGLAEASLRTIATGASTQDEERLLVACQRSLPEPLFLSSLWGSYQPPPSETAHVGTPEKRDSVWSTDIASPQWLTQISLHLAQSIPDSTLLGALERVLLRVPGFAEKAFPFIVHLVLCSQLHQNETVKNAFSSALTTWLASHDTAAKENSKLLINTMLYLRTQQYPNESSIEDRLHWLDVDYRIAASPATRWGMYKTALLFIELAPPDASRQNRRSSAVDHSDSHETLLSIFEQIDDPDAYYGLPEDPSLSRVLARVEYERDGSKSLTFRGAQYDSDLRLGNPTADGDSQALVKALNILGLSGISHSILQTQQSVASTPSSLDSTFSTARRLEIWNLPAPEADHPEVTVYKAYQAIKQAIDIAKVRSAVYEGFQRTMSSLVEPDGNISFLRNRLGALAVLTELDDVMHVTDAEDMSSILDVFRDRSGWMKKGVYDDVSRILSCRSTTMSMLRQHSSLLKNPDITVSKMSKMEIETMLLASGLYRYHDATQESLNVSTSLTNLVAPCKKLNVNVEAAVNMETADALWDHGEMATSIQMLLGIDRDSTLRHQTIPVARSHLLSRIAEKVSHARLEKPQDIQRKYLEPALKELKGDKVGADAGLVFHQFASFCDKQLQDPDGLEDLTRLRNLRQGKSDEVAELKELIANAKDSQVRSRYTSMLSREKQWLQLDEQELRRVEDTRNEFVRLSLENYLLSLVASDDHDSDVLRFTALWLERSEQDATHKAATRSLHQVPTRKFVGLMNQLTSRLQSTDTIFQGMLHELIYNICVDHPYHGMYQIWSTAKARVQSKDEVATQRVRATQKVAQRLAATKSVSEVWVSVDKASKYYHALAMDVDKAKYKSGMKIPMKESEAARSLVNCLARYRVPPPTMHMEVSPTKDYSNVPITAKLEPVMTIASGVSAPKIITAVATDGRRYKQLVKGGNDDLRQDSIMEQVFAAVSSLLKLHRATQQRNLGIRTYRVLPLTPSSGLIEFVPNTIPLHEFLMPAHERYHPKDWRGSQCRKEIFGVQHSPIEKRLSTYRKTAEKFQPVMRYFFLEHFSDPDDWFAKRLAYTRSTAAISMLGHVLGLGDRHGHNILLDYKTGEVVHIDLGVAFEAGRILPVPELVPFRLTRDVVDGMGITKTEGVFRRGCEFTLDALREEQESIMTILDVLRYDPLYTWSVSPLRLAKLQKARREEESVSDVTVPSKLQTKKNIANQERINEPSEADRALEVVRKKLSKTLSVTATVNDLINQATDERNLAVLYSGWAAYA